MKRDGGNPADRMRWFEGREGWAKAGLVIVYIAAWTVSSLVITVTIGQFMGYLAIPLLFTSPLSGLYQGMLKVLTRRKSLWRTYLRLPAVLYFGLMGYGAWVETDFFPWALWATGLLFLLFGIMAVQAVVADAAINFCLEDR